MLASIFTSVDITGPATILSGAALGFFAFSSYSDAGSGGETGPSEYPLYAPPKSRKERFKR